MHCTNSVQNVTKPNNKPQKTLTSITIRSQLHFINIIVIIMTIVKMCPYTYAICID